MAATAVTSGADQLPYPGRHSFAVADSPRFFGRLTEARTLAELWRNNRVTVVCGPSGVGRTSLLQAGVIPLIDQSSADLLPVGCVSRGTAFPVAALPEHNPHTLALLATWSPGESETRLSGLTVYDFLRKRAERSDPYGRPVPVLAAIDQVEDLLTGHADRYRQAFVDELAEALDEMPHLHLLLSIPDDYLEELAPYRQVIGHEDWAAFRLDPLSPAAAGEAVRLPLAGTDRWFAPGAAETLIEKLRASAVVDVDGQTMVTVAGDVDPSMLQIACAGLWASLPEDVHEITVQRVAAYNATSGALERFYEQAVEGAAIDHGIPVADLRSWLRHTFVTDRGTRGTAYEGITHTAGMSNSVVRALRDLHVLTAVRRAGTRWYELQHDALVGPAVRARAEKAAEAGTISSVGAGDYLRAAELAMLDGDLDLAERHAAEALRTAGATDLRLCAEAESLLGNVSHARRAPEQAEIRYRSAAVLFETLQDTLAVARLLAAIGKSLLAQGRRAEAVEYLHSAVERIPDDLTVQTELAWVLWHAGQQRAAVDVLTGVLAVDGSAPDALRARGEILADLGDAVGALRDLDQVRRYQRPSTLAAHGLALTMLRRLNAADPEIDTAISRAPDSGPVLLYAARAAALGHDPAMAADLARRAINATDPAVPPHQRQQALQLIDSVS